MSTVSEPCWMLYASFVISAVTLIALIYYACLTKQIAEASNKQTEALWKPWVVPERDVGTGPIRLINIGNGPAFDINCRVGSCELSPLQYLKKDEVREVTPNGLHSGKIECIYTDASGLKYRSASCVNDQGVVVEVKFESVRHK